MAESPSELQAEVEKLERKHAENPEGRYFVPLANDYRKMGELERAEALLREGLRKHPDYLSAHIVLGRCLADRGATGEAADEFTYVLSMDPQNLIALRSLGELSAADGRRDDAGRWYRELLAVDPMNEDARRALEELDTQAEPAPEPEPQEAGGWWDGRSAEGEDVAAVAADEQIAGDGARDEEPEGPAARDEHAAYGEFLELDAPLDAEPQATRPEYGMMELSDEEPEGEADEDEIESVEVVTETIAELYARQGLHDRAAEVYRELIRRRGGDPALERRLAELEATAAEAGAGAFPSTDAEPVEDGGYGAMAEARPAIPLHQVEESEPAERQGSGGEFDMPRGMETVGTAERSGGAYTPDIPDVSDIPEMSDFQETSEMSQLSDTSGVSEASEMPDLARTAEAPETPGAGRAADDPFAASFADGFSDAAVDASGAQAAPAPQRGDEPRPPVSAADRTISAYLASLAGWTPAAGAPSPAPDEEAGESFPEAEAAPAPGGFTGPEAGSDDAFPWETAGGEPPVAGAGPEESGEPRQEPEPEPPAAWEPEGEWEPAGEPEREIPLQPDAVGEHGLAGAPEPELAGEPEPTIELEDYFPADEEEARAPAAEEPASPPAAAQSDASAADDEDDLESFQAWLRSLKR